jgi:hypothetical protein
MSDDRYHTTEAPSPHWIYPSPGIGRTSVDGIYQITENFPRHRRWWEFWKKPDPIIRRTYRHGELIKEETIGYGD